MPNKLTEAEIQKLIPLVEQTKWHYRLDKFTDDSLGLINKSVNQARREVAAKLAKINPESKFTKQRLEALGQELQDMTVAIQHKITGQIENVVTEVGKASYPKHAEILSFGGLVPNFNNVQLTAAQLKSIVDTPLGGKLLNEWVETAFTANLKDKFQTGIATGMLKGESYKNLVKRFKTDAFEGLERDMEALTRTHVQSINTNAMKDTMMANADIMKGWKWNSVYENRTCIRCMSLDAKDELYPIDGGPQIPLHVNCRCFPEPITKTFRELGVDIDEVKDSYRPYTIRGKIDPVTGKVIPGKIGVGGGRIIDTGRFLGSYEDFFKQLPENVQTQMLGPTRLGLYKSGKLPLSGLTNAAGETKLLTELGMVQKGGKYVAAIKPLPNFKTISDIEKWAEEKGFEFYGFKDTDINVARDYARAINDSGVDNVNLVYAWDEVGGRVGAVDVDKAGNILTWEISLPKKGLSKSNFKKGDFIDCFPDSLEKYYDKELNYINDKIEMKMALPTAVNDNYTLALHEVGHIKTLTGAKVPKGFKDFKEVNEAFRKYVGLDEVQNFFSGYAATNYSEALAEAYVLAKQGKYVAGSLPDYLEEMLFNKRTGL